MKLNRSSALRLLSATVAAFMMYGPALAAGGLQKAESEVSYWTLGVYGLVGVASTIYLLYLALMAKINKGTWSDFFMGICYVALTGAVIVIGPAAWNFFTTS